MRKFMTEYSNGGADSSRNAVGECGSHRQPVAKIVDPVPQDHHPGNGCHSLGHGLTAAVGVTMGEVQHLTVGVLVIPWVALFTIHIILVISVVRHQELALSLMGLHSIVFQG